MTLIVNTIPKMKEMAGALGENFSKAVALELSF